MLIIGCRNDGNTSNGLTCIPRSSGRRRHRNGGMHTRSRNNAPSKKKYTFTDFAERKKITRNRETDDATGIQCKICYSSHPLLLYTKNRPPPLVRSPSPSRREIRNVLDRFSRSSLFRYTRVAPDDFFAYSSFSASGLSDTIGRVNYISRRP